MSIKIDKFISWKKQNVLLGNSQWRVATLIALAKDLPVYTMPIEGLNIYGAHPKIKSMKEWVGHIKSVLDADLKYPIILDEEGEIMDGRHRIAKALLGGYETIKFVRFEENPEPDKIINNTKKE